MKTIKKKKKKNHQNVTFLNIGDHFLLQDSAIIFCLESFLPDFMRLFQRIESIYDHH